MKQVYKVARCTYRGREMGVTVLHGVFGFHPIIIQVLIAMINIF